MAEVISEQPSKAHSPIETTELGMTVFLQPTISPFVDVSIIALQLFRESYLLLFGSTVIAVSPEQPAKAAPPISVTE